MSEPDFRGIDPLRVPEARRRIEVIKAFLALPDPRTADMIEHGARLGLSRFQFSRLVRAWREHRDPAMMVVSPRGPATRDYGLSAEAVSIAKEAVEASDTAATLASVAAEVERRCAAAGVAAPSRPTVWTHMQRARATGTRAPIGPPRIVVGRLWFHLPVFGADDAEMPTLLAAVLLPERRIVAHEISTEEAEPPSPERLVRTVAAAATPGAPGRALLIEANDRRAATAALAEAGLGGVKACRRSLQTQLGQAFGGRLGNLQGLNRRSLARPATKRVIRRQDRRLSATEAADAIEAAIIAHNANLAEATAFDVER